MNAMRLSRSGRAMPHLVAEGLIEQDGASRAQLARQRRA